MNRFKVSFIFEQAPKDGPWRCEWTLKDVEAAVWRAFYSETGGVSQRAVGISVERLEEKKD